MSTEKSEIRFRPFRRVKDKLVITSYMGWRKIFTANYYEGTIVRLLPFPEIKKGEVVYSVGNPDGLYKFWHPTKFEYLFWPVNGVIKYVQFNQAMDLSGFAVPHLSFGGELEDMKENEVYTCYDVDGCPTFSHLTSVYVAENYPERMHLFELLTATNVYEHFERMRDHLKNITWIK